MIKNASQFNKILYMVYGTPIFFVYYIYMCVLHTQTHTHTHKCIYVYAHTHTHTHTRICEFKHLSLLRAFGVRNVITHVCVCVCTHTHIYTYTYMYVLRTHTRIQNTMTMRTTLKVFYWKSQMLDREKNTPFSQIFSRIHKNGLETWSQHSGLMLQHRIIVIK